MIIDFHTHTFPDKSSEKIVNHLAHIGCIPPHTDGSVIGLFSSMKEADIDYSVNLPVMTKPSHHRFWPATGQGRQEDLGAICARAGPDRLRRERRKRGDDLRVLR